MIVVNSFHQPDPLLVRVLNHSLAMRDPSNFLRHHPSMGKYGTEIQVGDLPHHVLIFKLFNKARQMYRAFCAGSIISADRVLSSANCFLTNRKSHRHDYNTIKVVAGVVQTMLTKPNASNVQQWRSISKVYSQRFYRFPAYNLAVLVMDNHYDFNKYVNYIPYESMYHDFDGVCVATAVKATKSWSMVKYVYIEEVGMIKRSVCEKILQRSCRLYHCSEFDKYAFSETEGGGLVCHETGDPAEIDPTKGILVGVTSIINIGLPNLYMRIGGHSKWVASVSCKLIYEKFLLVFCVVTSVIITS